MKRLTLLSVSILLLSNLLYSQDIINETGKDGKFIVRDSEQNEAIVIEDGNVEILGTLSIDSLAQGTVEDRQVVWSTEDKQFKALYNLIPRSTINASTMAADSWTESGSDVYRASGNVGIGIATPIYPLTVYRSGANASVVTQRDGGAINYINATATHGTFGTVNNFVTRISQNAQIKIFLDKDNNGLYFGSNGNITAAGDDDIDMTINSAGNVGIGTNTPQASLHVNGDDGILVQGTFGQGTVQNLGVGMRMHFYPRKGAFRMGFSGGIPWDDANIGNYSVGMGNGTEASGVNSVSMGEWTKASGNYSTAIGYYTKSIGAGSTAFGGNTSAESYLSTAIGRYNLGSGNSTNWVNTDPLFEIGNGTSTSAKSNALTVLKNGQVGINVNNIDYETQLKIKIGTDDNFGVLIRAEELGSEIGLHTSTSEYSSLAKNAYYDAGWKRFDTSKGAFLQEIDPAGGVTFRTVASGTNPITWTGFMKFTTEGHLLMESEDPYVAFYSAVTHQWTNGSSRDLKTNIIPNEMDVFEILKKVNIVNYKYKAELKENPDAMYHIGFIAEDTPQILSGANQRAMVTTDSIGLLLAVVKEQQELLEELQKEVRQLKQLNAL